MTYLLLSILALVAGPFLSAAASRRPSARAALEGFVLVTIGGIVCLHIAPDAWEIAGAASVVTGALGLAFPAALERLFRQALARAHLVVLALAGVGIAVHAVLDGVALLPVVTETSTSGRELAAGVIIHRLPVGMAIWWLVRPQFGTAAALGTFVLVIVTTVVGTASGRRPSPPARRRSHSFRPSWLVLWSTWRSSALPTSMPRNMGRNRCWKAPATGTAAGSVPALSAPGSSSAW